MQEEATLGELLAARECAERARRDCVFLHALTTASLENARLFRSHQCDRVPDDALRGVLCRGEGATCGSILHRLAPVRALQHLSPLQFQSDWDAFIAGEDASPRLVAFAGEVSTITATEGVRTKKAMSTGSYSDYSEYSESHDDGSSSETGDYD